MGEPRIADGLRTVQQAASLPKAFADNLDLLWCSGCNGDLVLAGNALKC